MAGLLDVLDELVGSLSKHPGATELMGAIPAIAGAYMLARPQSRIGTPLGAGLATLGGGLAAKGYGDERDLRAKQEEQQKAKTLSSTISQLFPAGAGPKAPLSAALPALVNAGETPGSAIEINKEF